MLLVTGHNNSAYFEVLVHTLCPQYIINSSLSFRNSNVILNYNMIKKIYFLQDINILFGFLSLANSFAFYHLFGFTGMYNSKLYKLLW